MDARTDAFLFDDYPAFSRHYDVTLCSKLLSNNHPNELVLNHYFDDYAMHIAHNVRTLKPAGGKDYREGKDRDLLGLCRQHSQAYARHLEGDSTIVITHPFYLHLSHMQDIETVNTRKEVQNYLERILEMVRMERDRQAVNMVALDTIHHYAATTSLLLEKGEIDRVIFTRYNQGIVLDKDELADFADHDIFICGGYDGFCLTQAIENFNEFVSQDRIWAIRDVSIASPKWNRKSLVLDTVSGIDDSQVVGLADVLCSLGMNEHSDMT